MLKAIQILDDLFTEVEASDFTDRKEKNIFHGLKTLRNIIDAIDLLDDRKGDKAKQARAGKIYQALKIAKAIMGQLKEVDQTPTIQLVNAACSDLLVAIGEAAAQLKESR